MFIYIFFFTFDNTDNKSENVDKEEDDNKTLDEGKGEKLDVALNNYTNMLLVFAVLAVLALLDPTWGSLYFQWDCQLFHCQHYCRLSPL